MKSHLLRSFVLSSVFCLLANVSSAQSGWQWRQSGGGNGFSGSTSSNPGTDQILSSALDRDGNVIVGGNITWFPAFDTIHFTNSVNWDNSNFFLTKYDKDGHVLWARVGGGIGNDGVDGLDVDDSGNIYVFGRLQGSGNPVYINTPAKDTVLYNCIYFFSKFDKNGNLTYVKTYNFPGANFWFTTKGMFKRLKSGLFLSVITSSSSGSNIDGYQMASRSRNFVLFDSLGNVVKGALIDTISQSGSILGNFVTDANDNIYFPITNINLTSASILGHLYPSTPITSCFLFKTDTSFTVKDENLSGFYQGALNNIFCSGDYLYASGGNLNNSSFDFDTCHAAANFQKFTVYKIDTNLNLLWVSRPTTQTINPQYTVLRGGASNDNIYLGYQNRGTVVWDSANLVTPANTYNMAVLKLRTCDGVCVKGEITGGQCTSKDAIEIINTDTAGNGYFMGTYAGSIGTRTDTTFANGGATSPDFFILKWGLPNASPIPLAPDSVLATATGLHSVQLSWHNRATYRKGFHIFRSPNGLSGWAQIDTTAANVYTYTDNTVAAHTAYWYRVSAFATCGESPYSAADSALTWSALCPATVTLSGPATFCAGDNVVLTAPAGYSYLWSNSAITQSITVSQTGSFVVSITDNVNCWSTSTPVAVTVYPAYSQTNNVGICPGHSYFAGGANQTTGGTYRDTILTVHGCDSIIITVLQVSSVITTNLSAGICPGDSYFFKGQSLTVGGTYIDSLHAQGGCDSIVTLVLTNNPLPTVSLSGNPDTVCITASPLTLSGGSPAGGVFSGTGVAGGSFTPSSTGTTTITYTYTDNNTCTNTATESIVVDSCNHNCHAFYVLVPDTSTPHNWFAINQATGTGALTYNWDWADGNSSPGATPSHTYSAAANYNICLTITDGTGCTDTYCDSSTYVYKTENTIITINCVFSLPTGIADLGMRIADFGLRPNPANEFVTVSIDETLVGSALTITDVTGREVMAVRVLNSAFSIPTSSFASGVYFVTVANEKGRVTRKLVKQ